MSSRERPMIGRARDRGRELHRRLATEAPTTVDTAVDAEIAQRSPDEAAMATLDHGDPFLDRFTIVIPNDYTAALPLDLSQEQRNQEAMFLVRQAFLSSPTGRRFAWVPQAIEALRRSMTSDFLPDFGTIREISIDPRTGDVEIVTQARGASELRLPTSLEVLEGFSIERLLDELDVEHPLPDIAYSPDMAGEVAQLKPSAQYRWDLITRAARHAADGHNATATATFEIKPVVTDQFMAMVNGLGIFLHNNRGTDTRRWSVVKLVGADVPLTDAEARFFEMAIAAVPPDRFSQTAAGFYEFVYAVWNETLVSN